MNPTAIDNLKQAMTALNRPGQTAGAFDVLKPLSRLANDGLSVTIDMEATKAIGTPVIFARPRPTASANRLAGLTQRQAEVAALVIKGKPNKQIARDLGISLGTVKDHVHAILTRLDLPSRAALMALALSERP